jgi:hypothetical protein
VSVMRFNKFARHALLVLIGSLVLDIAVGKEYLDGIVLVHAY